MRYDGTTMLLRYDITTQSTAWHPMCMPPYLHDAYMCMLPTHVHAHVHVHVHVHDACWSE